MYKLSWDNIAQYYKYDYTNDLVFFNLNERISLVCLSVKSMDYCILSSSSTIDYSMLKITASK